jgi:hypothetical protein
LPHPSSGHRLLFSFLFLKFWKCSSQASKSHQVQRKQRDKGGEMVGEPGQPMKKEKIWGAVWVWADQIKTKALVQNFFIFWAAWSSFGQSTRWSGFGNLTMLPWWCGVGN